ncbi:MAG: META domain-containing protein [Sphingomonadaceae bacterium]
MRLRAFTTTVALALAMTACAPAEPAGPTTRPAAPTGGQALLGPEWTVTDIADKPKVPNSKVTIEFKDGRVFGAASCNRFMGGYEVSADGVTIKMSQMASTMMACPDALMDQEQRFLDTLGAVSRYSVGTDGVLLLSTPDGKTIRATR